MDYYTGGDVWWPNMPPDRVVEQMHESEGGPVKKMTATEAAMLETEAENKELKEDILRRLNNLDETVIGLDRVADKIYDLRDENAAFQRAHDKNLEAGLKLSAENAKLTADYNDLYKRTEFIRHGDTAELIAENARWQKRLKREMDSGAIESRENTKLRAESARLIQSIEGFGGEKRAWDKLLSENARLKEERDNWMETAQITFNDKNKVIRSLRERLEKVSFLAAKLIEDSDDPCAPCQHGARCFFCDADLGGRPHYENCAWKRMKDFLAARPTDGGEPGEKKTASETVADSGRTLWHCGVCDETVPGCKCDRDVLAESDEGKPVKTVGEERESNPSPEQWPSDGQQYHGAEPCMGCGHEYYIYNANESDRCAQCKTLRLVDIPKSAPATVGEGGDHIPPKGKMVGKDVKICDSAPTLATAGEERVVCGEEEVPIDEIIEGSAELPVKDAGLAPTLAPCPMLGCGSVKIAIDAAMPCIGDDDIPPYWVVCRACGMRGPKKETPVLAASAWGELCAGFVSKKVRDLYEEMEKVFEKRGIVDIPIPTQIEMRKIRADHALAERVRELIERRTGINWAAAPELLISYVKGGTRINRLVEVESDLWNPPEAEKKGDENAKEHE